jgi:hypothetical protein
MPFALSLVVQIALIVHVLRTGRPYYWIFIIMIPGIGALAYIIAELLPDFVGSVQGQRAVRGVRKTLDPTADLRQREREHRLSGSVDATRHLANELIENGQFEEAISHYEKALTGLYERDPDLLLGLATAQFANEEFEKARDTLDLLIQHNPDFKSADGHLLYARATEACGDEENALEEYEAVAAYYAGAEARLRYGLFLEKLGRNEEALEQFEEILSAADLAPRHYRKAQHEWIAEARGGIKRLTG